MNKKPFYNKDLFTQSKETSEIEILKFNHETLEKLGWIDEYGQPSGVFVEPITGILVKSVIITPS